MLCITTLVFQKIWVLIFVLISVIVVTIVFVFFAISAVLFFVFIGACLHFFGHFLALYWRQDLWQRKLVH